MYIKSCGSTEDGTISCLSGSRKASLRRNIIKRGLEGWIRVCLSEDRNGSQTRGNSEYRYLEYDISRQWCYTVAMAIFQNKPRISNTHHNFPAVFSFFFLFFLAFCPHQFFWALLLVFVCPIFPSKRPTYGDGERKVCSSSKLEPENWAEWVALQASSGRAI